MFNIGNAIKYATAVVAGAAISLAVINGIDIIENAIFEAKHGKPEEK